MKKSAIFLSISLLFLSQIVSAQKEKSLDPFEQMQQQMREMNKRMEQLMQQPNMMFPSFDSIGRGSHSFRFFNDGSGWKNLDSLGGGMTQIDTVMTDENGNRFSFKFFGNGDGFSDDFFKEQAKRQKELMDRLHQKPLQLPNSDKLVPRQVPPQDEKKKKYKMLTL